MQHNVALGLLGLLGDVTMVTVMPDLQTCVLPSISLRLPNHVISTHMDALSDLDNNGETHFIFHDVKISYFFIILVSRLL